MTDYDIIRDETFNILLAGRDTVYSPAHRVRAELNLNPRRLV